MNLDALLRDLTVQERWQHLLRSLRPVHAHAPTSVAAKKNDTRVPIEEVVQKVQTAQVKSAVRERHHATYEFVEEKVNIVRYVLDRTAAYVGNLYRSAQDMFYVHVPSWIKVHRAPFHHFGASLFGLAYTASGDVHIREDLEGDAFSEVLFHEVLHQLYPMNAEHEIRAMVRSRFGERGKIHQRLGIGH